jgi:hypothetical protein
VSICSMACSRGENKTDEVGRIVVYDSAGVCDSPIDAGWVALVEFTGTSNINVVPDGDVRAACEAVRFDAKTSSLGAVYVGCVDTGLNAVLSLS